MHPVRARLEPLEEAVDAVPLLLPALAAARLALPDEALRLLRQVRVRHVGGQPRAPAEPLEVVLAVAVEVGLEGLHAALVDRLAGVRDHQVAVDRHGAAEALAGLAGAHRVVEREESRASDPRRRGRRSRSGGPRSTGGGAPLPRPGSRRCPSPWRSAVSSESTILWRCPCSTATRSSTTVITPFSGCRRDSSIRLASPSSSTRRNPAFSKASRMTPVPTFFPTRCGKQHEGAPAIGGPDQRLEDGRRRVANDRLPALAAVERRGAGVERAQVVGDRGHRSDRRSGGANGRGAVHRDRRAGRPRSAPPAAGRAARGTAGRRGRRSPRSGGGPRRRARRRRARTCPPRPRRSPR